MVLIIMKYRIWLIMSVLCEVLSHFLYLITFYQVYYDTNKIFIITIIIINDYELPWWDHRLLWTFTAVCLIIIDHNNSQLIIINCESNWEI